MEQIILILQYKNNEPPRLSIQAYLAWKQFKTPHSLNDVTRHISKMCFSLNIQEINHVTVTNLKDEER